MYETAISAVVALLAQTVPTMTSSAAVNAAVDAVVALAPVVVKTVPALVASVKGIIDTLRGNSVVTQAQLDALDAAETKIDEDYEAALKAARDEDAAAGGKPAAS